MTKSETLNRKCLPEYLRKLSRHYPREVWEKHDNFNDLTQFWLSRHMMFRELISRLQRDTELITELQNNSGNPPEIKSTLARMTGFMLNQLHEHHNVEDYHYFPRLIPLAPELQRGFDIMESDHQLLDKNIHDLADKTKQLLTSLQLGKNIGQSAEQLLKTQQKFETFLDRHLCDEEELVIPVILEYGGPEF